MAAARTTPSFLTELGRLVSWHRRKLAVVAAMSAAAIGITVATPEAPPSRAVVVAGQRLAGGHRLTAGDLEMRQLPVDLVPAAAVTDPTTLVGRTLVAPLTGGSVLTEVSVLGARPDLPAGLVIAPVRIADPAVAALVRVGDRVDVVAADPESGQGARVIADQVRVVTIPRSSSGSAPIGGGADESDTLLLVAVTAEQAQLLADAAAGSQLSVLLS